MKKGEILFRAVTLLMISSLAFVFCVSAICGHAGEAAGENRATEATGKTITVTGLLVRQERLLRCGGEYVDVLASEGERLAVGDTVARQYGTREAMAASSAARVTAASGAEKVASAAARGDYSAAADIAGNVEEVWQSEAFAPDTVSEGTPVDEGRDLLVEDSGWFSYVTDGAESLTPETLKAMTCGELEQQLERTPKTAEGVFGKLVTDGVWYFAAVIPAETAAELAEGTSVSVSPAGMPAMEMTVFFVGAEEDGSRVVGFMADRGVEKVLTTRTAQAVIQLPAEAEEITESEE